MAEDSPSDAPPQPPPASDTQQSSEQSTSSAADKECPSPKPPSQQSDSSVMPQKEQSPTPTSQAAVTDLDLSTKTEKEEPPPPPPQAAEVVVSDGPPDFAEKEEQTTPHPIVLESEAPETPEKETAPQQPAAVVVESRSLAAMMEKEELPPQQPDVRQNLEPTALEEVAVAAEDKTKLPQNLVSFKEESNIVADLSELEKKALQELKDLVQEALNAHQFASPPPQQTPPVSTEPKKEAPLAESDVSTGIKPPQEPGAKEKPQKGSQEEEKQEPKVILPPEEVSIWGIPLLKDDRTDVILLKFLRARDFKVKDAFVMIKNTIQWRKDFGIDALVQEDLGDDLEKVVFMHGHDREGHPVCYNVYGEFQNRELYLNTFSDAEKRMKFLRCRIQFLERSIRKLDFTPGGVSTIVQVNDLKNSPGPGKRELRLATKQAVHLLQDNYPEFVAKQVFINVPWWYLAFYTMIGPFMTQRTKSKFVFAGPSKSAEVLFKYISPEQVPIQYGGLSVDYCDCNPEFTNADPVTEITVKPATKQTVEIIIYEKCVIVWEVRVVGWEVSYGAEFVPDAKGGYTVIIQKPTKMAPMDEPVVSQSFKVGELGKILLTVDNPTSKKKKLLYRFKVQPFCD